MKPYANGLGVVTQRIMIAKFLEDFGCENATFEGGKDAQNRLRKWATGNSGTESCSDTEPYRIPLV